MKQCIWLIAGIWFGLLLTGSPKAAPDPKEKLTALLKEKRDAAQRTFDITWQNYREGRRGAEGLYWWSRRWMEADQQLSEQKADRTAAAQKHVERMKDLEAIIRELRRNKLATIDELTAAEFYRSEAEIWLLQARNG
jgi:hypothetical protein